MADVKGLLEEGLNNINQLKWKNCVEHIMKEEEKLNRLDDSIDKTVDSFIINVTDSCTSENDWETDTDERDIPV
ncbi:unnamed protein product [Pieris macdunnoughi]|uniref:Uncharacterized protein n=1 Tax=Pieris macdunnoughi TaxID=345717 RepID=A0A821XMV2_9NEOP|nr:unnamed protein product [Pieris macdunnoughi]